jgi:hypothetical protein
LIVGVILSLRAVAQDPQVGQKPVEAGAVAPAETSAEAVHADQDFAVVRNPAFPPPPEGEPAPAEEGPSFSRADFAPYFGEGLGARAKSAFDKGRFDEARALLKGVEPSLPVRYLHALAALRGRDFVLAATEFERLADDYTSLRDRCLILAGTAYDAGRLMGKVAMIAVIGVVQNHLPVTQTAVFQPARTHLKFPYR